MNKPRGIACGFDAKTRAFRELLVFLAHENYLLYMPWLSMIYRNDMWLPADFRNNVIGADELIYIADQTIWEMELHFYPLGSSPCEIETYEDFLASTCSCCLIYYDCGTLEIYIKSEGLFRKVWEWMVDAQVEDLSLITDENDKRTALHL